MDKWEKLYDKNVLMIKVVFGKEYLKMLKKKLKVEFAKYDQEQNIEELADLLEVLYATAKARGYSIEELDHVRVEKQKAHGGFDKKVLLKSVNSD